MDTSFWLQATALALELLGIVLIYIELRHANLSRRICAFVQATGRLRDWEVSRGGFYLVYFGAVAVVPSIFFVFIGSVQPSDESSVLGRIALYAVILAMLGLALFVRKFGTVVTYLEKWSGSRGIGLLGMLMAAAGLSIDALQTWQMY